MGNRTIERLYDMAKGEEDEYGIPTMDAEKLRRQLKNVPTGSRNKVVFSEKEPKFHTCLSYNPCPICDKCMNKASHLRKECEQCQIPTCAHTYRQRQTMIRRENFRLPVEKSVLDGIKKLEDKILNREK